MSEQVTRGNLPHWYRPGFAHFVTYRLAGSIPNEVLRELRDEYSARLKSRPPAGMDRAEHKAKVHRFMFGKYDRVLDGQAAISWLADARLAQIVRENLYHHHGTKYELLAYCIMPNHVHAVLQPLEGVVAAVGDAASVAEQLETPDRYSVLSKIMHSLKSYTANRANELLGRSGVFWQKESYDHWIRDADELERIVAYVASNPVKAGLCDQSRRWQFSSAYDRYQRDGSESALVGWLRDDWRTTP
ncbi:MAG TPA: transposase [Pirellulaceae bacterium]|nr:transposase [Pirellulaceae bacterium]